MDQPMTRTWTTRIASAICVAVLILVMRQFAEPAKTIILCLGFIVFAVVLCIVAQHLIQRAFLQHLICNNLTGPRTRFDCFKP